MEAITSLLATTDFSDGAHHAVERAAAIASAHGAELALLHVVSRSALDALHDWLGSRSRDEIVEEARRRLRRATDQATRSLGRAVSCELQIGNVTEAIRSACAPRDLVVLGGRGGNPLRDQLIGTVAERLLSTTSTPALVVKRPSSTPYGRGLVAVDFSRASQRALRYALNLLPAQDVVVFNACEEPFEGMMHYAGVDDTAIAEYRRRAEQAARDTMFAMVGAAGAGGVHTSVEYGEASCLILSKVDEIKPDLLVLGKRVRSTAEAFFIGSVARHVVPGVACDVLLVPEAAPGGPQS